MLSASKLQNLTSQDTVTPFLRQAIFILYRSISMSSSRYLSILVEEFLFILKVMIFPSHLISVKSNYLSFANSYSMAFSNVVNIDFILLVLMMVTSLFVASTYSQNCFLVILRIISILNLSALILDYKFPPLFRFIVCKHASNGNISKIGLSFFYKVFIGGN